jgi:hypothetical protein
MLVILEDSRVGLIARAASPWDRLAARVRAGRLDIKLAAGASPEGSLALAVRAQHLVQTRARHEIARGMQRILYTADRGRSAVPVCDERIRSCSAEFSELISRLLTPGPVCAQGVAQARALVTDACGPVYQRASHVDLRSSLRAALDAL